MAAQQGSGAGWLRSAVEAGEIHTVRLSFADRLGGWRGKRIPAALFLVRLDQPAGFCDGMIVCDVQCGVHESTPFSNYATGYPDLHVIPDPGRIHPVGWVPGEAYVFGVPAGRDHRPLAVVQRGGGGQRAWLQRRSDGVGERGPEPGAFTVRLAVGDPYDTALASVVTKSALKETARRRGLYATFMTRPPGSHAPSLLTVRALLPDGAADCVTAQLTALAAKARPLLQPSVNAFKAGTPAVTLAGIRRRRHRAGRIQRGRPGDGGGGAAGHRRRTAGARAAEGGSRSGDSGCVVCYVGARVLRLGRAAGPQPLGDGPAGLGVRGELGGAAAHRGHAVRGRGDRLGDRPVLGRIMTAARHAARGWNDLVWIDLAGRPRVVRMAAADDVPAPEVDALAAADQATLLRWYTRQIARRAGLDATFMAKPWTDQAGNGMHVHQSVWRDGSNLFGDGAGGLSAARRQYVAGLLEQMGALALFGSPTPNAYHRRGRLLLLPHGRLLGVGEPDAGGACHHRDGYCCPGGAAGRGTRPLRALHQSRPGTRRLGKPA